ncbi:hypothetical protein GLW08_14160 [Pontibacillus yanchengensis]|uniref:Uncharacterized protein n=1 Tax=Pontibacillus yanchengensis TaxID=462910 RepID=A0ACC7VK23_9BACI|nr:hypothetical protein [Pontibacillus yanchengensis]MYL54475.1 hypothetical protein [Pontibacillus yanchengensis]
MKNLSNEAFQQARSYIMSNGRPLEQALFTYEFADGSAEEVLQALKQFQNEDGGFGNGLEADFRLPHSSPTATSVAFQHLIRFADHPMAMEMIEKAIRYLEYAFIEQRQGWLAVPEQVNDYPHAFWWTVRENGMTWIDANWGNPSAELIGYLHIFEEYVQVLPVPKLVDQAVQHLLEMENFESEHEIYCYLRLLAMVPSQRTEKVENQLTSAVQSLVKLDRENWQKYTPFPLKFIATPEANHFGIPSFKVEDNLDFFVEKLEENGHSAPTWEWTEYIDTWEVAKKEWSGILTLGALISLRTFDRLQA